MIMKEYPEKIVAAFLNNYKMTDVIRDAGISKNTAYRYRNDPEFQKYLRLRKDEILKAVMNQMQSRMVKDLEKLDEIIDNPESSGQVVINAINYKWHHLRHWTETVDLVNRIEALENPKRDTFNTK